MQFSRRTFLVGIGSLALATRAANAQEGSQELLAQIPGLETAYARRYSPASDLNWGDFPIEPNEQTPHYLLIMALKFSNAAMLQGVLNAALNPQIAGFIMQRPDADLIETSVSELPEGNVLFVSNDEEESHPYASLLVLPVGDTAFLLDANGDSADIQTTLNDIASFLEDAEPADNPVVVEEEGVATGGPFDLLPGVEDLELLNGLVPLFDYDLLVSDSPILPTGATPESSPHAGH